MPGGPHERRQRGFSGEIRRVAERLGHIASAEAVATLNLLAQATGQKDDEGTTIVFAGADGTKEGVQAWIEREIVKLPKPAAPKPAHHFTGRTAAAITANETIRAKADADWVAYAEKLAAGPNPWRTGNRTAQAVINNVLPAVAARLKAQP